MPSQACASLTATKSMIPRSERNRAERVGFAGGVKRNMWSVSVRLSVGRILKSRAFDPVNLGLAKIVLKDLRFLHLQSSDGGRGQGYVRRPSLQQHASLQASRWGCAKPLNGA